jgi:hypothetical protein
MKRVTNDSEGQVRWLKAVVNDGLPYLNQLLSEGDAIQSILPAGPSYLAVEFIVSQVNPLGTKREKAPPDPGDFGITNCAGGGVPWVGL